MQPTSLVLALSLSLASLASFAQPAGAPVPAPVPAASSTPLPAPFKTPLEATSYAVGADMIRNFKSQNVSFDLDMLVRGLRDASGQGKLALSETDIKRLVSELELDVRRKMVATRKADGETNLKKSEEFLKANGARAGVVTLASGVQYLVVKNGTGPKATDDSTVVANYKGTLPDGTVFDASPEGKPVTFKLAGLIPGWREALKLMPAGSKWQLALPPSQAYGERGAGRVVGPNQALRFDVEIVEVK